MTISQRIHINREQLLYAIEDIIRSPRANVFEVMNYVLAIFANSQTMSIYSRDF